MRILIDRFFLGGFEFHVVSTSPVAFESDGNAHYRPFSVAPSHAPVLPEVHAVRVIPGGMPPEPGWKAVAVTPAWRLQARENQRHLSLTELPGRVTPPSVLFRRGGDASDVFIPGLNHQPAGIRHPWRYPLDQMRLLYLLAEHRGMIAHAAGAVMAGGGVVFAGRSGAGKSTITRLLAREGVGPLLSDDRVIVRAVGDDWQLYGTPWPGDAQVAASDGAPLRALCFLRHGGEDRLIRLDPSEALHRLLEVVSVPWFDREAFPAVLDTCEALVRRVPAFELCFRPTPAVLKLLGDAFGRVA